MGSSLTSQTLGRRRRRRRAGEHSFSRTGEGHYEEHWGERMGRKDNGVFRLLQLNLGTMAAKGDSEEFRTFTGQLDRMQVDCLTGQEINRDWSRMQEKDRLHERFRGVFETIHVTESRYKNEFFTTGSRQFGGTAVFHFNSAAHRIHTEKQRGIDPKGLGRWSSTRLAGKRGRGIRIISAYRPNSNETGELSVYAQHLARLAELNDDRDPLRAFAEDLRDELSDWNDDGDMLILGIDLNGDVRDEMNKEFFHRLGMREVLMERHGDDAPETYADGSKPIDGIFASYSLDITAGGYLAFGDISETDHRGLWIDIPMHSIFGSWATISRAPARRIISGRLKVEKKYSSRLEKHLKRFKCLSRARANTRAAVFPASAEGNHEWEKLDKIMVEGRRYAEKRCRRLKMGGVPWTPELGMAYDMTALCRQMIKRRLYKRVSSRYIDHLCRATGEAAVKHMSLEELLRKQRESKAKWRALKKNADASRTRFYELLAQEKADAGNTTVATELRKRRQEELQRDTGRRLAQISGKHKKQTTTVFRTRQYDDAGNEVEAKVLEKRSEQVDAVLSEYEKRLRSAQNKGLMVSPLVEEFGYLGLGDSSQQVLDGTYSPPSGTNDSTTKWFQQLQYRDQTDKSWEPNISRDDFQHCWKRVRTKTAAGFSGLYANHFKSTLGNTYIAEFDREMANYPFKSGYSPERWRIGLDAVIPKKIGNNFIEDSRTILLFELDSNVNNKILAKKTMAGAESRGSLSPEQYGSRKDLSSAEQSLNKRLIFDLAMLQRRSLVDTAVDLKSCYDLIGHSAASLSMQSQGAPAPPVVSMLSTLQDMEHHCVTSFGISEESFGGDVWSMPHYPPPQGGGQGNGAGPCLWATTSTPCFEAMRDEGFGASFATAITDEPIDVLGTAFVDDTNLDESPDVHNMPLQELVQRAQAGIDLFAGCITATGGEVRPDKSWWYALAVTWRQGIWSLDFRDHNVEISVANRSGSRDVIERLAPDEARELLGVWMAPDGNNTRAIKEMSAKAQKWADKVRTGLIRRSDVWLSLQTQIGKSLEYPLTALALTEAECDRIEKPIRKHGLEACGIKKTLPSVVVDGPLGSHGIGRKRLYHVWAYLHVAILMKHGPRASITGKFLRACKELHQLEAGTAGDVLASPFSQFGEYATRTWIKSTWRFLSKYDVRIDFHSAPPPEQRYNDQFLMEAFAGAGVSASDLRRINRCRMYLQALTVADISTGDGKAIRRDAWSGISDIHLNRRRYRWAYQERPGAQDWRVWREALSSTFLAPTITSGDVDPPLRQRLGNWNAATNSTWRWYLHSRLEVLYEWTGVSWRLWRPTAKGTTRTSRKRWLPVLGTARAPNKDDLRRTTVFRRGHDRGIWSTGPARMYAPSSKPQPRDLVDRLQTGNANRVWATQCCVVDDNGVGFAAALRAGTAIAVSDGSYKDCFGTAACILQDITGSGRFIVLNVSPGAADDQSPYRSELSGLYGIVSSIEQVCEEHDVRSGSVTIACDGQEALLRSVVYERPVDCTFSDFDLISAIRSKIKSLPVTVRGHWVEGHQDDLHDRPLDIWAQLNIWCDALAKRHWARTAHETMDIQWAWILKRESFSAILLSVAEK